MYYSDSIQSCCSRHQFDGDLMTTALEVYSQVRASLDDLPFFVAKCRQKVPKLGLERRITSAKVYKTGEDT